MLSSQILEAPCMRNPRKAISCTKSDLSDATLQGRCNSHGCSARFSGTQHCLSFPQSEINPSLLGAGGRRSPPLKASGIPSGPSSWEQCAGLQPKLLPCLAASESGPGSHEQELRALSSIPAGKYCFWGRGHRNSNLGNRMSPCGVTGRTCFKRAPCCAALVFPAKASEAPRRQACGRALKRSSDTAWSSCAHCDRLALRKIRAEEQGAGWSLQSPGERFT